MWILAGVLARGQGVEVIFDVAMMTCESSRFREEESS